MEAEWAAETAKKRAAAEAAATWQFPIKKAPQRPQRLRARLEFYYLSKAKRLMASKRYDPPLFRDADGDLAGLPMRLLLLDQMPACQLRCAGEGQLSIALCAGERVLGRTSSCKRSRDVEACRDMFLQ